MRRSRAATEIPHSTGPQYIAQAERTESYEQTWFTKRIGTCIVLGCKQRPPIDIDIVVRAGWRTISGFCPDEDKLLLDQQLDHEAGQEFRRIQHGDVKNTGPELLQQLIGHPNIGMNGDFRFVAFHPDQPVQQYWIPEAELTTQGDNTGAAGRYGKLLPRSLPNLNK